MADAASTAPTYHSSRVKRPSNRWIFGGGAVGEQALGRAKGRTPHGFLVSPWQVRQPVPVRLPDLIDIEIVRRLAEANYEASGMPVGLIDAVDGSVLVGFGWQDICVLYHRRNPITLERCRESDAHIKAHLSDGAPCEYVCRNGLRDIGVPILVAGEHLATLFLGQFFYEGEAPDRQFFVDQARAVGFDQAPYLTALDRVPVFPRARVENILRYNVALARFIGELAERALEHAKDEAALREAERRRTEFIAMLSHELRNPLAPIRNALYVLERPGVVSASGVKSLAIANRQLRHLSRMVDDLMDVTRLAGGEYHLDRHHVDLGEVVRAVVEDHRPMLGDRGLAAETRVPDEPVIVDGDAARLTQVLGNLLLNAAKFTDRGGKVVVVLELEAGLATIRVRDSGIGISPDLLGRIFEPFVQADETLARTRGGLGVGLAVVKRLVALHGGEVRVHSDGPGKGAEFVVSLPVAGAGARGRSRGDGAPSRRVLIIEDNDDTAATLKEILEFAGHEVRVEGDGLRGLETALQFRPEVVLCDIGLPGIDGYEVARRLRAVEGLHLLLVAVTGYSSPEDVRLAQEAGFAHHVAKPADLDHVTRLVAQAPSIH
jgi:signal transduction histidine kinase/CheY-like chemotaxis protein